MVEPTATSHRLISALNTGHRVVLSATNRWQTLLIVYAILALLAFPILESSILGKDAPQYAHDVFDDGMVSRLGAIAADWRQFGLSLWNPHLTAGNPSLSQFAVSPFSLDVLLTLLVSPFIAYVLTYFLLLWIAGYAMHIFLRDSIGLGDIASLTGGVVYVLGFWQYNGFAAPLFPLVLWLFDKSAAPSVNRWRYLAGSVALVTFLFYNSHSQVTLLLAGLHLAYVVAACPTNANRRRRLAEWAGVWALGLLMYGPALLTQLVFLPESQRTIWSVGSSSYLTLLSAWGISLWNIYISIVPSNVGVIALPIFVLGLIAPRKSRKEQFLLLSLILLPLLDLFALLFLQAFHEQLGFLKTFQFNRILLFMRFAFAANVAIGIAYLYRVSWHELTAGFVRKGLWGLMCITFAWMAATGAYRLFTFPSAAVTLPSPFPPWLLVAAFSGLLVSSVFGGAVWLAAALKGKQILNSQPVSVGRTLIGPSFRAALIFSLLILVTGERAFTARMNRLADPGTLSTFHRSLGVTPAISFLKSQPNPEAHRTLSFRYHANRMMFHRLYAADGYENIYPLRYHELFGLLTAPFLDKNPVRYEYFHGWGNRAYAFGPDINLNLASLMGIRWFYSRDLVLNSPELNEVFQAQDSQDSKIHRVYENPRVFPRAFIVDSVRSFSTRDDLLAALSEAEMELLRNQAYVLETDVQHLRLPERSADAGGMASIVTYEPDKVVVEADTASPAILVLTDIYAPGWVSKVNGERAEIFPVYNAFRGVRVPAGRSQVTYTYAPTYTYIGAGLALFALVLTGVWCMVVRNRRPLTDEAPSG